MKAISLWEPWGSLIAVEAKRNETRGRKTNIRGDVVICAARQRHLPPERAIAWLGGHRAMFPTGFKNALELFYALKFGHALCVVELYDCIETSNFGPNLLRNITLMESELGDYTSGRYAWLTRNCRRFAKPFPVRGRQGWFDVPDEQVRAAL